MANGMFCFKKDDACVVLLIDLLKCGCVSDVIVSKILLFYFKMKVAYLLKHA